MSEDVNSIRSFASSRPLDHHHHHQVVTNHDLLLLATIKRHIVPIVVAVLLIVLGAMITITMLVRAATISVLIRALKSPNHTECNIQSFAMKANQPSPAYHHPSQCQEKEAC